MNEMKQKIIEFANSNGYNYALYAGEWNEYEVYQPIFWEVEPLCIGLPYFILVNEDKIRMTNDNECFEVLNAIYQDDQEDECILENEPIKLDPNLTIKSLKFERGGYFGNYQVFEYKVLKRAKVMSYNEEGEEEFSLIPGKVEITDKYFDKYALEMIKYFHEDLGTNPNVCDGEWYEFSATLSNGQKLKSHGYNYFPFTYEAFLAYLEHYFI